MDLQQGSLGPKFPSSKTPVSRVGCTPLFFMSPESQLYFLLLFAQLYKAKHLPGFCKPFLPGWRRRLWRGHIWGALHFPLLSHLVLTHGWLFSCLPAESGFWQRVAIVALPGAWSWVSSHDALTRVLQREEIWQGSHCHSHSCSFSMDAITTSQQDPETDHHFPFSIQHSCWISAVPVPYFLSCTLQIADFIICPNPSLWFMKYLQTDEDFSQSYTLLRGLFV